MKRLLYVMWALALVAGAAVVWRGILGAMGDPLRLGYAPGRFLEYDEEVRLKEQSLNGPYSGEWEYVRRGKVRVHALAVEADGTIELLEAWRRDVPTLSKYTSNQQDMLAKFGGTFAEQLNADPIGGRHQRVKPTGDPIGATFPQDLEPALDAVFRRARLLPGGHIDVGDKGDWTERIGPLTAKFEWKVSGREQRSGRPCLVYEVRPIAVLAVKPESMPNFMGSIVWHSGKDEGYVTTKGSVVKTWLAEDERIPVAFETLEKSTVVPQRYVSQNREATTTWTLAREDVANETARKDAATCAKAEDLASADRTSEAIEALKGVGEGVWSDWAAARAESLTNLLPLTGRPCPPLPEGEWRGDTPKTIESFAGKVLIVDFWLLAATPCFETMKALKGLRGKYGDRGLCVVGVTCEEPQRESEQILKYLGDALIDYPTLIAKRGLSDPRYQVKTLPYCLLVDRKGVVRWTGSPADPALEVHLQALLKE